MTKYGFSKLNIVGLSMIIFFLMTGLGLAQDELVFPPLEPTAEQAAEFERARSLASGHDFVSALEILERLAGESSGTSLGADLLSTIASLHTMSGNMEAAAQVRESIIAQYPNSRFEVLARLDALDTQLLNASRQESLDAYSILMTEFGGPSLASILENDSHHALIREFKNLSLEFRSALPSTYGGMFMLLYNEKRYDDALALCQFGRAAFDTEERSGTRFDSSLIRLGYRISGKDDFSSIPGQPQIHILSPTSGGSSGTAVRISVQIGTGDYRHSTTDLRTFSLVLDGQEVGKDAIVTS